ncbi:MAG: hypothetical protein IKN17_05445 [Ruminococcus sp.]|nr:hypothetical protein [Ruminococcus sp.]
MGFFANLKQMMEEQAAARAAEERARYERLKPYYRGYDVFPDEVSRHFEGRLRRSILTKLLIMSLFLAGLIAGTVYFVAVKNVIGMFLCGPAAFFLLLVELVYFSDLTKMINGDYDAFGAMVTNTRVVTHTSTDSEGQTTTTHDYFVSLNGIESEVSQGEFKKVGVETYCYFVRLKGKYIKGDKLFLFPCNATEADHRIGQHYPSRELRLYKAPSGHWFTVLLIVLGVMAAIGGAVLTAGMNDKDWIYLSAGGGGLMLIGVIARGVSVNLRNSRAIEEKRRAYDRQQ